MSKGNLTVRATARDRRQLAADDLSVPRAEILAAAKKFPGFYPRKPGRYVSAAGLAAMVNKSAALWAAEGIELPWNLDGLTSGGFSRELGSRWGKRLPEEESSRLLSEHARFAGWLREGRNLPAFRRMVRATQSHRGTGSPRTTAGLWRLFKKFPSPGGLDKLLARVRQRTEAVLRAYEGQKPSWAAIATAILADRRVGKAAVIATAYTLGAIYFKGAAYRAAREWLVEHCKTGRVLDASDGVEMWVDREPVLKKVGVTVTPEVIVGQYGRRSLGLLVRLGERAYHVGESWTGIVQDPRFALRQALNAWRQQDCLLKEEADTIGFLQGDKGVCPLIFRDDSYQAGNCSPGTEVWLREMGWSGRSDFIPGVWLIPHLADSRVKRVVAGMMQRV